MNKKEPVNKFSVSLTQSDALTRPLNLSTSGERSLTRAATITAPKSAAFDINQALNPLIGAASPILMAVTGIMHDQYLGSITLLYDSLTQEIKTFEEKVRKLEYRSAITLASRYFLCTYADEILSTEQSSIQTIWEKKPLLKTLQDETYGGERFFMILERASEDPKSHLDLLELGFLILSLGYKGKYRQETENPREIEHIRDNLYTIIKKYRGDLHPSIFVDELSDNERAQISKRKPKKRIPHLYLSAGIFIIGLISVYIPYQIHLDRVAKKMKTTLDNVVKNNINNGEASHD